MIKYKNKIYYNYKMSNKEYNVVLYGRKNCKYCKLSEELLNKLKKDGVNIKKNI